MATLSIAGLATTAVPAEAATISVTAPQAQMSGHTGTDSAGSTNSPANGDRYRFGSASTSVLSGSINNTGGSNGSGNNTATNPNFPWITIGQAPYHSNGYTGWVSNGTTAWTAHGYSGSQPGASDTQLNLGTQSAIGFEPASITSVETGAYFNLGRMVHRNNPVSASNQWFTGNLNIRFMGQDMSYQWLMNETPNGNPVQSPRDNDITSFLNQVSDRTFVSGGLTYTLVVRGFTETNASNNRCIENPTNVSPVNQFSTEEGTSTYGCLYASVEQVRDVTVRKVVVSPYTTAPSRAFDYTSTSTLAGSVWSAPGTASIATPQTPTNNQSFTHRYNSGEGITITEGAQTAPWSFTSLRCVDGTGASIGNVTGQTVTIPRGTTAASSTAAPITCTYTNTYTPRATLTLRKNVTTTGQPAPVAVPADWTLTAQGEGLVSSQSVSGPGNSASVTSQSVVAGTYALSETAAGVNAGGYAQSGNWTCTGGVTVTNGRITLTDGQNTTCTVSNVYQTGSLNITKTVTSSPAGGYTGGTSKAFTASYVCTTAQGRTVSGTTTIRPNATNGQAGAVSTISNLPAGASCVVTETGSPTGTSTDLVNGSWVWGNAAPASQSVTIPANGTATANITNPVTQNAGSLVIGKTVTSRAGTPASGYTGGSRVFPISYSCSIGGTNTGTGTVNVPAGGTVTVPNIPSTSICTLSETLGAQTGDFADASFQWDGNAFAQPVAVPVNGTASGTVTNYFKRNLATLVIQKDVTNKGAYNGGTFAIDWQCGSGSGALSGTVNLADGAESRVQVPVGVACTVVEQAGRPSLDDGYVWGTPTYQGLTDGVVSVPLGGERTVKVTNPIEIGFNRISLDKQIAHFADQVTAGTSFQVAVSCDAPARGETDNYSNTFTFTTPLSGVSQVTPYLPVGTSCSVEETARPTGSSNLPNSSYIWTTPSYTGLTNGSVTVTQSTTPTPVVVINDIERVYGPLRITKDVDKPSGITVSAPFTGTWSCEFGGASSGSGTWSAPAGGGAATLTGNASQILVGSLCTVTENSPANPVPGDNSYVWAIELPALGTRPITTDGVSAEVKNTLNRTTGSFSVTKSVTGGTAGTDFANTDFTFDYTCQPLSGDAITGVLEIRAGSSASPDEEIPTGSTCSVTERTNALPAPVDPNRWDGVDFDVTGATGTNITDGIRFVTPDDAGASVAVIATNTMSPKTGSVAVTKSVTQLDGGFVGGSNAIFPMTLTCKHPRTGAEAQIGQQSIANGGTYTWSGIPVGANCSVQEGAIDGGLKDASFGWNLPEYSHDDVTVPTTGTPTITVTNTMHRVYGGVSLNKIFDNGGFTGVVPADRSYAGAWECTYGGAVVAGGTWTGTGSAAGTAASLTVTTGSLSTLPLTASCTATENTLSAPSETDSSYKWLTPVISGVGSISSDASENVMTVTNTLARDLGAATARKTLSGETAGYVGGDDFDGFPVGYVCALDPADLTNPDATRMMGEIKVQPGAAAADLFADVPRGWSCAVNEGNFVTADDTWLYDDSYAWSAPVLTVNGAVGTTFKVGAAAVEVAVDNPITREAGSLEIAKQIAAGFEDFVNDDAGFSGAYECVYEEGTDREETFEGTWSVDGTGAATLSGDTVLPYGTTCSVTETTPSDDDLIDASWTWDDEQVTPGPATVSGDGPASFTVTNTPKRVYSSLEITKALTGPADGFTAAAQTVTGTWECTYGDATVNSGTWTAPAVGGPATLIPANPQIPVTANCVVREDTLPTGVFKDASYAWGAAPSDGNATIEADEIASVTITNVVERRYGNFQITKTIDRGTGVTEQVPGTDVTYSGTYQCTYAGVTTDPLPWSITNDASIFVAPDVYADTECEVLTESPSRIPVLADNSFVWGIPQIGDGVTISDGTTGTINVVNPITRLTGTFGVTKVVEGDVVGLPENPVYAFEWECTADNGDKYPTDAADATFQLEAGGQWGPRDVIPYGSSCTVTETAMPTPLHDSFTWNTVMSVSGLSEEVLEQDGPSITFETPSAGETSALVTATNTLTRGLGTFEVTKIVPEGSVVDEEMTFSGEYVCTGPLADDRVTGTWGPIEAGETWTSDDIPLAADCELTSEVRPVWPNSADHADQWDGDPVFSESVASAEEPETITVTNTTIKVLGSVTWAKVIAGTTDRLAGSVWTLTGPGLPDDGIDVIDCLAATCAEGDFLDQNPAPGEFLLVGLEWGGYTLVEKTPPAGYYPDLNDHPFTIGADEPGELAVVDVGGIENTRVNPPVLPFTGGLGRDFFTIVGLMALILGLGAVITLQVRNRRREVA